MKCCCSRDTTGIVFGSLYILGSVAYFIFALVLYIQTDKYTEYPERKQKIQSDLIESMIICGSSAAVSSLFIVAIVKRYQYLIVPWLLFAFYVFYVTLRTMYWWFIGAAMGAASLITFLILLLILVASVAFEIYIFCLSCFLFKEIRLENIENLERVDKNLI